MLNDAEIETILAKGAQLGVRHARYTLLRLPHELTELFSHWLDQHYPSRKNKILNTLRDCRQGALNDPRFRQRMQGQGIFAELIAQRFAKSCRRWGLSPNHLPQLNCNHFNPPPQSGTQLSLF